MKQQFSGKLFVLFLFFTLSKAGPVGKNSDEHEKLLAKSREMKSFMNESIDPCQNFYEFTCGNWINIHPAEGDTEYETNYLLVIKKAFDKKAIATLMNTDDPADTVLDKKIKDFYKSCLKLKNGVKPSRIKDVIAEFGKMPNTSSVDWDKEHFDWVETLGQIIKKYNYPIMMGVDILADMRDNSKNRIYIGEGNFDLESKSVYLETVGARYRMMYTLTIAMKLNKLLDMDLDDAQIVASEIVEFEVELAKGMVENKSDRSLNELLLNTTVEEMHKKYAPTFDVKKFFKIIFDEIPNEMIYEYVPDYLKNLKRAVENTDKRIIANYIFYQLIKAFEVEATESDEEHTQNCFDKVNEKFAKNIDNMIYRRFNNNKEAEEDMQRIWNELKALFKAKLQSESALKWLSQKTRQTAIEKLEMLKLEINSYMDRDLNREYEELITNEDDYVGNLKNITSIDAKRAFAKLNGPLSPVDAGETLSITPANILIENTVKIPVALLQPYFVWAPNFPDALKFGITGYLLAHELIHAFDETGRQFGKDGNLNDWWDAQSAQEFEQRRACFRDQYHSYIYGEKPLPLSERQSENIADNSGLKLAFEAYTLNARREANQNSNQKISDESMIGMNYTSKQLFFIGFAQFWCSDVQTFLLDLQAETDEHTPAKFRTIGTISNLKEFAEAFQCKSGSEMNPSMKCEMY